MILPSAVVLKRLFKLLVTPTGVGTTAPEASLMTTVETFRLSVTTGVLTSLASASVMVTRLPTLI